MSKKTSGVKPVSASTVLDIDIELILKDEHQPRKMFRGTPLNELVQSIKDQGVKQPVIVNVGPVVKGAQHYIIKYGERRWRAQQAAGFKKVRCVVLNEQYDGEYDFSRVLEQTAENFSREPHTHGEMIALVEASVREEVKNRDGKEYGAVAIAIGRVSKALGKEYEWAEKYHRLSRLHPGLQKLLDAEDENGRLSIAIALKLIVAPKEEQKQMLTMGLKIRAKKGHAAMVRYIGKQARASRVAQGEKLRGQRPSDGKKKLQRLTVSFVRSLEGFFEDRTGEARKKYITTVFNSLNIHEIEEVIDGIGKAAEHLRTLLEEAQGRRNEHYKQYQKK